MRKIYLLITALTISSTLSAQDEPDCNAILNSNSCMLEIFETGNLFFDYLCSEQWLGKCNLIDKVDRVGSVSIGTNKSFSDYNLMVTAGIMSETLRVCNNAPWCDYVFDDNYHLMPLLRVKEYLEKNKHLPGCLSEDEIIANGYIDVEETLLSQQEKIEEIYLHLISLNKKIKILEKINK